MARPIPTTILHMTHLDRLTSVIEHGLLPDSEVLRREFAGVEIGYRHIKDRRARRAVDCGAAGTLADYVPFYFAPNSPMLYAITRGRVSAAAAQTDQIVYLCSSTQRLRSTGRTVVVSNRHPELAYADLTDADELLDGHDFVDWALMRAKYWNDTEQYPDRKERRQAECLIHPAVPWTLVERVVTKTEESAHAVRSILSDQGQETPIDVRRDWYF